MQRRVDVRRGGSPTTRWQVVLGQPGRHLQRVVDSYGEYTEFSTSPVSRREIPGPAIVLIIELIEPLFAKGAADEGGMRPVTASSAVLAGGLPSPGIAACSSASRSG